MNPRLLILLIFMLSTLNVMTDVDAVWFNESWDYRKNIQIDGIGLNIPNNYQLLFANITYESAMNDTFKDMRFTWLNDTTEQEIDYWIEVNVSETNATLWLEVPEISNTSNETVYMYYGNPTAESESNANATLGSDIEHFYTFTGNALDLIASIDMTNINSPTATTDKDGNGNSAYNYDGINDIMFSDDGVTGMQDAGNFIMSAWIYPTELTGYNAIISHWDVEAPINEWGFATNGNKLTLRFFKTGTGSGWLDSNTDAVTINEWNYIVITRTGSTITYYVNGVSKGTQSSSIVMGEDTDDPLAFGSFEIDYTANPFKGKIDEVRLYSSSTDINLILNQYTATEPTYSFGAEESQNTAPTVTLNSPADDSTNTSKTVSFQFTPTDDAGYTSCALWTNETSWSEKETNTSSITNNSINTISETFTTDGTYLWNVKCIDSGSLSSFASSNWTISIDSTLKIEFISPTETNDTTINVDHTYINTTITAGVPDNLTAFIDWNYSLVGWWRFDNSTDFLDHSSYSNDGTNEGSTYTSSGRFSGGRDFDGSNDYIDCGNDSSLNFGSEPFSIELWMKSTIYDYEYLIIKGYTNAIELYIDDIEIGPTFALWDSEKSLSKYIKTNKNITDDTWHHIVAFRDDTNISIYIDGILENTTGTGILGNIDDISTLKIGGDPEWGNTYFSGTIDEVKLWNRALSPEEINASYDAGTYRLENNFTNLDSGIYEYIAYVQNLTGNIDSTEIRTITIDTIPPTITIYSPENTTYSDITQIDLNVSANETIDSWNYSLNGGANMSFNPNTTINVISGQNNITVWANDTIGNIGSTTVYFYVANTSIIVTYSTGTDYLTFDATSYHGTFSADDQTDSDAGIIINNTGNSILDINMSINTSIDSCIEFWVSEDNTLDTGSDYNITNTNQTVLTNLNTSVNKYLWSWAIFDMCTPGDVFTYDVYFDSFAS